MSYQVLARKWRPQNFEQMVGQQHVLRALVNALEEQRLHHAYLFTGTRGVGKTTIARILVKCLNCETGITAKPCGQCGSCREIAEGRFVDLLEVDAASRTKVEDTRELLDNIHYAPTHGRFKVYLIDEVHMLSGHSFNALLKTLEEPPEHVKFLLATTDPQKLPATILSRCLQFNLKRMPVDLIQGHLQHLLQQESITFEAAALKPLARAADGSMRDALSLMDQAIAFSAGSLKEQDVKAMLGTISQDWLVVLLQAMMAGDGKTLLDTVEDMAGQVADFEAAADSLISLLHQIALFQAVPSDVFDDPQVKQLATHLSMEDVQLYYQIALNGRKDLPLAPDPRSGFEMLLLRMMVFRPMEAVPLDIQRNVDSQDVENVSTSLREEAKKKPQPTIVQQNTVEEPPRYEEIIERDNGQYDDYAAQFVVDHHITENAPSSVHHIDDDNNSAIVNETLPSVPANASDEREEQPQPQPQPQVMDASAPVTLTPYSSEEVENKEWDWHQIVPQLSLQGMVGQFANHCLLDKIENDTVFLLLDENAEQLHSVSMEQALKESLEIFLSKMVNISVKTAKMTHETPAHKAERQLVEQQLNIEQMIADDAFVQALQTKLGAHILPGSIKQRIE